MLNRWTRLSRPALRLAGVAAFALLLAACKREPQPIEGAPDEPVAAVEALAGALAEGDLVAYSRLSLPPELRAKQAELWRQQMAAPIPIADDKVRRYNELMATLTAPDAEARLWAAAEPRLAAMQEQVGPKWALGVTMLSGFATAAIAADPTLSDAEQSHAEGVVDAVSEWAKDQANFTDPARAKQAIGIAVRTARAMELPTLEAARTLEYDAMLGKASVAFRGSKEIAGAFGVDIGAALAQVQADVVELDGPRAVVRVRYPLLGKEVSFEQPMVRIGEGWYREDAVQSLEKALAEQAAAMPPAVAGEAATGEGAPAPAAAPAP